MKVEILLINSGARSEIVLSELPRAGDLLPLEDDVDGGFVIRKVLRRPGLPPLIEVVYVGSDADLELGCTTGAGVAAVALAPLLERFAGTVAALPLP